MDNNLQNGIWTFIVDYIENNSKYKSEDIIEVKIWALAYTVSNLTFNKFPENFTWYLPYKDKIDEFQFIGEIIYFEEVFFDNYRWYILTLKIAGYESLEDSFVIPVFVNEKNLNTELKKWKKVSGVCWLFCYMD